MNTITKEVRFVAKEDSIEELKALLEMMVEPSRAEEGVLLYNIYQREDDPKTFVVFETWESEEALKGHQNTSHYKVYKSTFEQYCAHKESHPLKAL